MRKTLVTGGTGYLGGRLVRKLLKVNVESHVLVRETSLVRAEPLADEGATVHRFDGTLPRMCQIVNEVSPDVVYHLATYFVAQHQREDVEPLVEANVQLGAQLLVAMDEARVTRLVSAGTTWQHFGRNGYRPVSLYAATKQAFDDLCTYFVDARELRAVTLKICDTYGPDDPRPKLVNLLLSLGPDDEPLRMSPGEQLIDLVHADDVVQAFLVAGAVTANPRADAPDVVGPESFTVTSGRPLTLRALVDTVSEVVGYEIPVEWGARPYRDREIMVPWRGGGVLPGWKPTIGLDSGVRVLASLARS